MPRSYITRIVLLAGTATMLQGCVAAIAPIAASGLMGGSGLGRDGETELAGDMAADPTVTVERSSDQMTEPTDNAELTRSSAQGASTFASSDSALEEAVEPSTSATPTIPPQPVTGAGGEAFATLAEVESEVAEKRLQENPPAEMPVRVIAVDPEAALSDVSGNAPSVSAAEAAAALSVIAAAEEAEPVAVDLARKPPEALPPVNSRGDPVVGIASAPSVSRAPSAISSTRDAVEKTERRLAPRPLATGAFASLINYANQQQSLSPGNRNSAVLEDRASLQPDRAPCGGAEPTVLIDLDPEGGTFDPTNVPRAAPGLSSALAQLRTSGVKIAWISGNAQGQVGAIREALNRSGLDLQNTDQLLLMRYPEDRKQTRREDLAASACLIAIAGDARSDFDELFEYLLNPEAASTLDPLMGKGWFLIPPPLVTERPAQ